MLLQAATHLVVIVGILDHCYGLRVTRPGPDGLLAVAGRGINDPSRGFHSARRMPLLGPSSC